MVFIVGAAVHTYIVHTYIHKYIHTYIHTYTHMYIRTYVHTYMYIHTYVHTVHTYMYMYVCTFRSTSGITENGLHHAYETKEKMSSCSVARQLKR